MEFIEILNNIPEGLLREYIDSTRDVVKDRDVKKLHDIYNTREYPYQYMIDDYNRDCIGFFYRNKEILYKLIDNYNCDLTEKYFIDRKGDPPILKTADIIRSIDYFGKVNPIDILYQIKTKESFIFIGCPLMSSKFDHLELENITYDIITELYTDHSKDNLIMRHFFSKS